MQLDQIYSAFANTVSRECFDAVYKEATEDAHGFLYIDVVPKEPWMQFRKGFNDFLVVQGNEIRNLKTNWLKRKGLEANEEKEDYNNSSDEEKDTSVPKKKTQVRIPVYRKGYGKFHQNVYEESTFSSMNCTV